jgi:hypothetical protein
VFDDAAQRVGQEGLRTLHRVGVAVDVAEAVVG